MGAREGVSHHVTFWAPVILSYLESGADALHTVLPTSQGFLFRWNVTPRGEHASTPENWRHFSDDDDRMDFVGYSDVGDGGKCSFPVADHRWHSRGLRAR